MTYDPEVLLDEARKLLPEVVRLRRQIHRHPEIGLTLPHTQGAIIDALSDLISKSLRVNNSHPLLQSWKDDHPGERFCSGPIWTRSKSGKQPASITLQRSTERCTRADTMATRRCSLVPGVSSPCTETALLAASSSPSSPEKRGSPERG